MLRLIQASVSLISLRLEPEITHVSSYLSLFILLQIRACEMMHFSQRAPLCQVMAGV